MLTTVLSMLLLISLVPSRYLHFTVLRTPVTCTIVFVFNLCPSSLSVMIQVEDGPTPAMIIYEDNFKRTQYRTVNISNETDYSIQKTCDIFRGDVQNFLLVDTAHYPCPPPIQKRKKKKNILSFITRSPPPPDLTNANGQFFLRLTLDIVKMLAMCQIISMYIK